MGKKSTSVAEKEKDEVAEESSDEFEEGKEASGNLWWHCCTSMRALVSLETPDLPTVELGDFVKVKQVLDETVVKAVRRFLVKRDRGGTLASGQRGVCVWERRGPSPLGRRRE